MTLRPTSASLYELGEPKMSTGRGRGAENRAVPLGGGYVLFLFPGDHRETWARLVVLPREKQGPPQAPRKRLTRLRVASSGGALACPSRGGWEPAQVPQLQRVVQPVSLACCCMMCCTCCLSALCMPSEKSAVACAHRVGELGVLDCRLTFSVCCIDTTGSIN